MASALSERAASWSEGDKTVKGNKNPLVYYATRDHHSTASAPGPASLAQPPLPRRAEVRASTTPSITSSYANNDVPALSLDTPDGPPVSPKEGVARSKPARKPPPAIDSNVDLTEFSGADATPTTTKSGHSHDRATDPVVEPPFMSSPAAAQENNPSSIPLPESRPDSPVVVKSAQNGQPSVPSVIDNSSRPVSAHAQATAESPATVPPPLPRRAAARAAPKQYPPLGVESSVGDAKSIPTVDEQTDSKQTHPDEATSVGHDSHGGINGVDQNGESNEQETANEESVFLKEAESSTVSGSIYSNQSQSTILETESSSLGDENLGKFETGNGVAFANGDPEDHEGSENEGAQRDKDGVVYVGDATWEERTWKQVILLKEAMFRARVGLRAGA